MKKLLALAVILLPAMACAQVIPSYTYPSAGTPPFVLLQCNTSYTACLPVTANNPFQVGGNVTFVPPTSTTGVLTPAASTVTEGSHVAKASAGNLFRVSITTGASAGYLMGFNLTTDPADGAVTPVMCRAVAANSTLSISNGDFPSRWATGITFAFSSTGCFTKTESATAYFEWAVI